MRAACCSRCFRWRCYSASLAELRDVVIGVPADGNLLSGPCAGVGIDSPNANIYETLIRMSSDCKLQPWLAE